MTELLVGCRFDYRTEADSPAIVLVEPHSSLRHTVVSEEWDGVDSTEFEDLYGNRCRRLVLPAGATSFGYRATVRVAREAEAMPGSGDVQHWVEDLPSELLHWLLPSRLCESDALTDRAWELFGETPRGAMRVQAISDWIHENITYGVPSIPTTATLEILERRGGMCRDFAHLGIGFCRALGIPARYTFGYLPDIDVQPPYPEQDFHAWFEVWLGDRWWTFDARFNTPRVGRVPIGRGRDAVDVAMVTSYGPASLERMTVLADEVLDGR
ncbi:MAG: transglutaminase family protein [Actinobacteria bacterium]|nr:transglutaminase family protein [Actinomycetota bacterium]